MLLSVALEVTGDVFFKKWAGGEKPVILWIGFTIYALGALVWAYSLRYESLSKAIAVFTISNLLVVSLIGTTFFNESISITARIGIAVGVLSILLIELG